MPLTKIVGPSLGVVDLLSVSGNGTPLTSLNASALLSGTVPVARLSSANTSVAGVVDIVAQTFAGAKTFQNAASFSNTVSMTGAVNALSTFGVTGTLAALGQLSVTGNATFDTNTLYVDATNDRIGIGTLNTNNSAALGKLSVVGGVNNSIMVVSGAFGGDVNAALIGHDGTDVCIGTQNSGTKLHLLSRSAGVFTRAFTLGSAGNVGIGTASPQLRLEVWGAGGSNGDAYRNVIIFDTTNAGTGVGGGIAFGGYYSGTSSAINDFGGIQGFKENGTAENYAGALKFTTRTNGGSPTERMRITSGGHVAIGATARFYFDGVAGTGDSYFTEASANRFSLVVGGTERFAVAGAGIESYGTIGIGYFANGSGTSTGTAVVRNSSDAYLYLQSSSRRFKENISEAVVTDAQLDAFMATAPSWWDYKGQKNGALGFIAEDLAALPLDRYGFNPLVNYDGNGDIESNRDYALIAMHHLVIQRLERKIAALEARIH